MQALKDFLAVSPSAVAPDEVLELLQPVERENAKLREQIHWLERGDIMHVLTDQEYIDQCERERLMQVSIDALDAENTKLLELADAVKEFVEDTHCEDCPFRRDCNDNNRIFCADDFSYHAFAAMRELGVEVK